MNKKKIIIFLIILLALFFLFPLKVQAYTNDRLFDDADLFTAQEEQELLEQIKKIEEKYDVTTFIITINDNPYTDFADPTVEYIEQFGEQQIGDEYIGFIIDMENRGYAIDVFGTKMFDIYTDSVQINIEDSSVPYLSDGEYFDAATSFLDGVKDPLNKTDDYIFSVAISGLIALVVSGVMTFLKLNKHKEKKIAVRAEEYLDAKNQSISLKQDRYIRTYTTKTAKQSSSSSSGGSRTSTHRSSSGRSHSGRSGKF